MKTPTRHAPGAQTRVAPPLASWPGAGAVDRHRPGPWVGRSLARAGHHVLRGHPESAPGGRTLGSPKPLRYPSPTREPERFVRWVREACRALSVDVVLPLDEDGVRLLADHSPRLGDTLIAGPDARQYRMLCDKDVLGATAEAAGVGRPRAVAVGDHGPTGPWPPLPSIVKPHRSTAETGGIPYVVTVYDGPGREQAVADLVGAGLGAIVEERLEGRHWVAHCVRAADGRFAGVAARVVATSPRGAGTPSVLEVVGNHPPVLEAVRRLFAHVGYVGLGNAQFFERDGRLLVHDVNLRPPASIGLALRAGFDGPALGIAAVLGDSTGLAQPDPPPFTYMSAEGEAHIVARRLREEGRGAAARHVASVVAAGLPGGGMMDPPLWDIAWIGARAGRIARQVGTNGAGRVRKN